MEKIVFYPSIFTPEEINAIALQIIASIENSKNNEEKLLTVLDLLKKSNDKLTKTLNSQKVNPFTNLQDEADNLRDDIFVGGKTVIHGMTYYIFDENIKEAALRLEAVIRRHGWSLQEYSYQDQTSAINSLLKELNEPQCQADLKTIRQLSWVDALAEAQAGFEKVYNNKANYESTKESAEKRKAALPVRNDIEKLVLHLNYNILFYPEDETQKNTFNHIAGIIAETTKSSRQRRSGNNRRNKENTKGE